MSFCGAGVGGGCFSAAALTSEDMLISKLDSSLIKGKSSPSVGSEAEGFPLLSGIPIPPLIN